MSTDRTLLEAAARAAGIEQGAERLDCAVSVTRSNGRHESLPRWNPLADDGDALRLAVKLRMHVHVYMDGAAAIYSLGAEFASNGECNADPYAATRRAIVRAAAAMAERGE